MNSRIVLSLLIVIFLAMGCSAPRVLPTYRSDAEKAMQSGNTELAVQSWKKYFEQQATAKAEVQPADFAAAAKAAGAVGQDDQAVQWFDQARFGGYADPEMYQQLASIFRKRDNLSRELTALEYLEAHYPENSGTAAARSRMFSVYLETDNPDKAIETWKKLDPSVQKSEKYLNDYFVLNRKKENKAACDSLASVMLSVNPLNTYALEWNAEKYYWLAENRYQREMEKYNRNKTTRQYQLLVKELELVTADFKKSLVWFDQLWKKDPGEKYAPFMTNIYARFGNPEKADYYKGFIKKN